MVQTADKERGLDDVILDVFEQAGTTRSGRHFYFPVTSQAEAREFVCELFTRRVHCSIVCDAVGEVEQNFTAWRTGMDRPSIGNRVIERINRPVQQVLLDANDQDDNDDDADDDDDDDVRFSDIEDDDDVLTQFSSSIGPPPSSGKQLRKHTSRASSAKNERNQQVTEDLKSDVTTAQTTLITTQNKAANVENCSSSVAKTHAEVVHEAAEHPETEAGLGCVDDDDNNNNNNIKRSDVAEASTEHVQTRRDEGDINGENSDRVEIELSSDETDTAELERVEKTQVIENGDDEVRAGGGWEAEDGWVSELSLNLATADAQTCSSEHRQITVTSSPSSSASSSSSSSSSSLSSVLAAAAAVTEQVCLASVQCVNTTSTTTTSTITSDSSDSLNVTHSHLTTADIYTPEVSDHVTSQPETQTSTAAAIENTMKEEVVEVSVDQQEEMLQSTVTGNSADMTSSTAQAEAAAIPEVTPSLNLATNDVITPEVNHDVTSQPETRTSSGDVVDWSVKPEVVVAMADQREISQATTSEDSTGTGNSADVTSSTAELEATGVPEVTSSAMTSSAETPSCVLRKTPVSKDDSEATATDDVDENYDSDDDEEEETDDDDSHQEMNNSHSSSEAEVEGRKRGVGRGKRWGRQYEDDGPGYMYVFTDTPPAAVTDDRSSSGRRCRVKISASRRPDARLRQAKLFNVDMRLVTAVNVSSRLAAACLLRQRLAHCAIPATVDWFILPVDVVINGVMDVARLYSPSQTRDDHDH